MKNKESTRFYSDLHEKNICKRLGGKQTSNSGANRFQKGDVIIDKASLLIEAKCSITPKNSISIKKDWIEKNTEEAFRNRLQNNCICFNFEPFGKNFYVIDENLMKLLVEILEKENT